MFRKKPAALWNELDPPPVSGPGRLRRVNVKPIEALVILIGLAVFVGFLLPVFVTAERADYTHRYLPPDARAANSFRAIAGEYTLGDGRGLNWALSILPDGRYSFRWSGCMGVYNRESGTVKRVGNHVVLSAVEPIERRIPRVFLPVTWGRRTYLIPPEELESFTDAIIKGDEPRNEGAGGHFYVAGLAEAVGGVPELPEPWATFLRKSAVIGTVVEVRERGRVKVDVGSADGMSAECIITVQGREHGSTRHLRIVAVNERTSLAEQVYPGASEKPLAVGDCVVVARELPPH
jgi:hypothetical protein